MKALKIILTLIAFVSLITPFKKEIHNYNLITTTARFEDPLPSWTDNNLKKVIINYVLNVTNSSFPVFIPEKTE